MHSANDANDPICSVHFSYTSFAVHRTRRLWWRSTIASDWQSLSLLSRPLLLPHKLLTITMDPRMQRLKLRPAYTTSQVVCCHGDPRQWRHQCSPNRNGGSGCLSAATDDLWFIESCHLPRGVVIDLFTEVSDRSLRCDSDDDDVDKRRTWRRCHEDVESLCAVQKTVIADIIDRFKRLFT